MQPITVENVSKSYGMKTLFKEIQFTINENDKIGIIGINGTGKSTLLKLIAGQESPDSGTINKHKHLSVEFMAQHQSFNDNLTVIEQVLQGPSEVFKVLRTYEAAVESSARNPLDEALTAKVLKCSESMTRLDAWELESQVKTILTKLSINDFNQPVAQLSGGQKKRLALAASLITPCDLLILDEPTNHMDNETIDWLEDYLQKRKGALLMITHDRYFLDRVTNKILEIDHGDVYTYEGNYSTYLEKKLERIGLAEVLERKRDNLYRRELSWIRRGAKARSTKQKARIERFETLENTSYARDDKSISISVGFSRLGKKTIELNEVTKAYDEKILFKDFTYQVLRDDRLGIVGPNGIGKTTLLNVIIGNTPLTSGTVEVGDTVKIGHFSQESSDMPLDMKAIDYIKETAEYIETEDGQHLSASIMLERFLFDKELQYAPISSMSGGERRRLYLLKTLMMAPNVLLLDEPTNDLDIDTLKVLEAYLDDYKGIVITVSHDRYFLDRTCHRMLSFEPQGKVVPVTGNYSDFLVYKEAYLDKSANSNTTKAVKDEKFAKVKTKKPKMTYQEKKDYDALPALIDALESRLNAIEDEIALYTADFVKLQSLSDEKDQLEEDLLDKMAYYETLDNLNDKILNYKDN